MTVKYEIISNILFVSGELECLGEMLLVCFLNSDIECAKPGVYWDGNRGIFKRKLWVVAINVYSRNEWVICWFEICHIKLAFINVLI